MEIWTTVISITNSETYFKKKHIPR